MAQKDTRDRKETINILDRNINFYRNLAKYDIDYNPYKIRESHLVPLIIIVEIILLRF